MIDAFLISIIFIFIFAIFYLITKDGYLKFNLYSGNVWPILIYREFFMVFSALLLVSIYGVDVFDQSIFYAKAEDLFRISIYSIYAIFSFSITVGIFSKYIKFPVVNADSAHMVVERQIRHFANSAVFSAGILLLISFVFLNYQHAFLSAIFTDERLLDIRLRNSYESLLPSQLGQIVNIAWWIIAIYTGFLIHKRKFSQGAFYGGVAVFFASAPGDKAPLIICFMIVGLSFSSFRGINIAGKFLIKILCFYFPFLYILVYFVVSIQTPDMSFQNFNIYLLNRLGVGQMSGVFETFSMEKLDGQFYWQMLPGASIFADYIPYDKALMLATEDYGLTEMGVKNSLFISEAYGIGGILLVFLSPFIVGASYSIGLLLLSLFLKLFFNNSVSMVFTLPLYILSSALTGGFSSFPLFKGLILEMVCLVIIWCFFKIPTTSFNNGFNSVKINLFK
ncbi:MAG: hypothetical protein RR705_02175 [Lachnospiraceae bacterium]